MSTSSLLLFKEEALKIQEHFPELKYMESNEGIPFIAGDLTLWDNEVGLIDRYSIKIESHPNYPNSFPLVFETAGRLPINIDWHVFSDGHCCIKAIPEEILACRYGITLLSFIEKQVKPYFFNQKYREIHGYFLQERTHGLLGNVEFFKSSFRTNDLLTIVNGLSFIRKRNEPTRSGNCFCGSGEKYRKCHRNTYRQLNMFTDEELNLFIGMIQKMM